MDLFKSFRKVPTKVAILVVVVKVEELV